MTQLLTSSTASPLFDVITSDLTGGVIFGATSIDRSLAPTCVGARPSWSGECCATVNGWVVDGGAAVVAHAASLFRMVSISLGWNAHGALSDRCSSWQLSPDGQKTWTAAVARANWPFDVGQPAMDVAVVVAAGICCCCCCWRRIQSREQAKQNLCQSTVGHWTNWT